jgi:hypothetical protein
MLFLIQIKNMIFLHPVTVTRLGFSVTVLYHLLNVSIITLAASIRDYLLRSQVVTMRPDSVLCTNSPSSINQNTRSAHLYSQKITSKSKR